MGIIVILSCLVWLVVVTFQKQESKLKKVIGQLFCVEWFGILIMSSLNLYDLYSVSWKVMMCVFIHICFFVIGYICHFKFTIPTCSIFSASKINNKIYCSRWINVIAWLMIVPLFIVFKRYISYANVVGAGSARVAIFSVGEIFHSATECQLYLYLGYTYFFVFSSLLIYGVYTKKILKSRLFFPVVLGVMLYLISGGGRLDYITLACELLVISLVVKGNKKKNRGKRYKFLLGIIIALVAIVIVTGKRFGINSVEASNIKELLSLTIYQIYEYAVGPLRAFDYAIDNYIELIGFNWGRMTIGALDELFGWGITLLGIPYEIINFYYGGITQGVIYIGENHGFNALYTALFHFFFDFGVVGVALSSFLFGMLLNYVIKRVEVCCSMPNIILLCLLFFGMIMLPITWILSAPSKIIIIVICFMWDRNGYRKIE